MSDSHTYTPNCPVCGQHLDAETKDRVWVPDGVMIYIPLADVVAMQNEIAELRAQIANAHFKTIDHGGD